VDLDRFRFGSVLALGVLPLGLFGILPGGTPLSIALLGVTALFAVEPSGAEEQEGPYRPDRFDVTAALADGGRNEANDAHAHREVDGAERRPWV
jgi:hypothetical protein